MKPDARESLASRILVRVARISQAHDSLPLLESWLTPCERERASRFHFAEGRSRFILGRGLLRKSLSPCLGQAPETIHFTLTDRDRPILPGHESLQFSLSHSGDLVAIALTANAHVGIDVEWVQNKSDLPELAERILSRDDFHAFQALPETEKIAAFFRIWTRKEAYLKATGEGITDALQKISVPLGPEEISVVTDSRNQPDAKTWTLSTLSVPDGYMGCVACDRAEKHVVIERVRFDQSDIIGET